jgi:SAM-dependent methyltransferase
MLSSTNPKVQRALDMGRKRYEAFQRTHKARFGQPLKGRVLDFGCGAGDFLMAATEGGLDAHGVDVEADRETQFLHHAKGAGFKPTDRFKLYDGRLLPHHSNSFDGCYSWFVFEHVSDPQVSLREITRVLKPGGTLTLYADDVRNAWDGHAIRPWPPYLPREFAAAYLEGLGLADQASFITNAVVYISAPAICDILTTLGMEILYATDLPAPKGDVAREGLYVTTPAQARALGQKMRGQSLPSPVENLQIFARKPL